MGAEFLPLRMFPLESYESAIQVLPAVRDGKPRLVFFDREIDSLTVHPRMEGLTVARLTVAIPKHAWDCPRRFAWRTKTQIHGLRPDDLRAPE